MLEAIFLGISGLLQGEMTASYKKRLLDHYDYLKQKFSFEDIPGLRVNFRSLRPSNFRIIRLSQLAQFYTQTPPAICTTDLGKRTRGFVVDSQALLELKNYYCHKKRCLRCAVGFYLFDFSS